MSHCSVAIARYAVLVYVMQTWAKTAEPILLPFKLGQTHACPRNNALHGVQIRGGSRKNIWGALIIWEATKPK